MMIFLGGIELSRSLVWADRFSTSSTISSNRLLLDGNNRILQASTQTGRIITLEAQQTQGWLTKAQVDLLAALSDTIGATYTLDYEGETHTVAFDHSDEAAVSFAPLVHSANQLDTDYLIGTIHLITV